jgi:hypothetical protein
MSSVTVEMIKQFPEDVGCDSLAVHGDVVYIGSVNCVIQWNVAAETVVRLEGYPNGLILQQFFPAWFHFSSKVMFMVWMSPLTAVLWLVAVKTL